MKRKVFVIALVLVMLVAAIPVSVVYAAGPSSTVGVIGGNTTYSGLRVMHGGWFSDLPGLGYTFTDISLANVNAANLAGFDTILLNVGGYGLNCNPGNLTAQAKADLVAWVGAGNKLIISDSECRDYNNPPSYSLDYSWLPYPFTTSNPGALGAQGTLINLEDDTLSSDTAGPSFIDVNILATQTDAIGDMNVMVTMDPAWCVDLTGTNAVPATGPVQTYARYGSVGSVGLFIYNGFDWDECGQHTPPDVTDDAGNLAMVWKLLLDQQWNPDGLPCGYSPVGITLNPDGVTNPVGTEHQVFAKVADILGNGTAGVLVTFTVTSGPNAGATGTDTTDNFGDADWTYPDTGGLGTDTIKACFTPAGAAEICSKEVTKIWNGGGPGPEPEVGGIIYPVNTTLILTAFIVLAVIASGTAVFMWRRKVQS